MIHGATLRPAIAEGGDDWDDGGLSELMATNITMSRVKSANRLLLLRAFCANLFQMGALPGPYCPSSLWGSAVRAPPKMQTTALPMP